MGKVTKDMVRAIREIKSPYPGLAVDIVEFPDYVALRVYENQIMALSDQKRVTVMEYLQMLRRIIESFGVKGDFDGAKGDPPRTFS